MARKAKKTTDAETKAPVTKVKTKTPAAEPAAEVKPNFEAIDAKIEKATVAPAEAIEEKADFEVVTEKNDPIVENPAPAKKAPAKKAEAVIKCTIEFNNKNTVVRDLVDQIMDIEGKDNVKTLDLYVQPENNIVYYVVNGTAEGKSINF